MREKKTEAEQQLTLLQAQNATKSTDLSAFQVQSKQVLAEKEKLVQEILSKLESANNINVSLQNDNDELTK